MDDSNRQWNEFKGANQWFCMFKPASFQAPSLQKTEKTSKNSSKTQFYALEMIDSNVKYTQLVVHGLRYAKTLLWYFKFLNSIIANQ